MSDMSRRESRAPVLQGRHDFGYFRAVSRTNRLKHGGGDSTAKHPEPLVQSV
jgi:hypothetical protein